MGYAERNVWSGLVASVVAVAVYAVIVLPQLSTTPVDDIAWQWPLLWSLVGGLAGAIVLSVLWGIAAGMRDPHERAQTDVRDVDIERMGSRVGYAFTAIGGVGALVLSMLEAHWFWIGNALFVGFFLSAFVGGVAQLIAYRRGL